MFIMRRWWDRHGVAIVLGGLTLGAAWLVRQTQGAAIFEAYQLMSRPFQVGPTKEERLIDARVMELQERLVELETQNQKLKELLDYSKPQTKQGIVASIVGRSADHWWQQVTLGRGSSDGIKVGYIVMAPGGLVGRISSVTPNSSRVLLLSDATSRVGAVISRSRSMGFIRGQGSNRAVLQFFDKVPDVRRGDVVSTSPVSQLFPPGLPLGRVESVNLDKSPAPEAVIELTAPVSYLEWVMVYPEGTTFTH
jgi:rod shape-determining protein MreC